jgi:hypothetical protein
MSYKGFLWWGTMHVPGLSLLAWQKTYGKDASEEDARAAILGTYRPISIFRGEKLGSEHQQVELLYGSSHLPRYTPGQGWEIVPNKMGQEPKYGEAGINNFFNNYTWWMEVFDDRLFVGTMDFLYLGAAGFGDEYDFPPDITETFEDYYGADLWSFSSSRHPATPVSLSGVGNFSSYGVRTMVSDDFLYLGMANPMNLLTDPYDDVPEGGWELIKLATGSPDYDKDGDVDGDDLAVQAGIVIIEANRGNRVSLAKFAENFGRNDCQKPQTGDCDGVKSPGYWKNHRDAWPEIPFCLPGYNAFCFYPEDIRSGGRNKCDTMIRQIVAAELNNATSWCPNYCIDDNLNYAEKWYINNCSYGKEVKASSRAWQEKGEGLCQKLDVYNNGRLCSPKSN